ncbi:MAG: RNA-binding protein [Phycisphaerae bacterium]|nr:RNA-binding protein [Phycisphaerae bacterium]|tara:strand:- start:3668 stop:5551 length:1884 start_codon:yes stop_codon:yes gene_type:complete
MDRLPDIETEHREELVPADDAIIGRAFWWSLLSIGVVAAIGGGLLLLLMDPVQKSEEIVVKQVRAPETLVPDLEVLPDVRFTDVTLESGIGFVHESGARGDKFLPETMGSGAAFLDMDRDGDQDLLLINAMAWPESKQAAAAPSVMRLYANDGRGQFTDVTASAGIDSEMYGTGVAVGDVDADGLLDFFVAGLGFNRLYRNLGDGRFEDISGSSGVQGDSGAWSTSPAFLDIDGDGDLDLFVPNYVEWSSKTDRELDFTLNGRDRAYGPPIQYRGTHPYLYENLGDGAFRDVSEASGMHVRNPSTGVPVGKSLAVAPIDLDRDGAMDLVVANDTTRNFLYHNQGDGTFVEVGMQSGIAFDGRGSATGAMGIDAAHYRNDALLGIGIGNFANEMTSFYVSDRDPMLFTDEAILEGIGSSTRPLLSFGLFFFDYDLDGRLDLFQTNGHLEEEISQVQPSQRYRQPAQLFWNSGDLDGGCFELVPSDVAGDLSSPIVGRGAAYADIDGDGDLDVLVTQVGARPLLLRNDQELDHHWIRIAVHQDGGNRDAIGAWIELVAGGVTQRRQVMPTRSYLSQVELPITFGLGVMDRIDSLRVVWPDGAIQDIGVDGLEVDRPHAIIRSPSSSRAE